MIGIGYVVERFIDEYQQAVNNKYVLKPMAYTLYKLWKHIDETEKPRKLEENDND